MRRKKRRVLRARLGTKLSLLTVFMLAVSILVVGGLCITRFYSLVMDRYENECVTGTNILAYHLELLDEDEFQDLNELLDGLKERTGCEFTIFDGDIRAYTTVMKDGERAVGTKLTGKAYNAVFQREEPYVGQTEILGEQYLCSYVPTLNEIGKVDGLIFAGMPIGEVTSQTGLIVSLVVLVSAVLMGLDVLWLLRYMHHNVSWPLGQLTKLAQDLESGDLGLDSEGARFILDIQTKDEVGYLCRAMEGTVMRLCDYLGEIAQVLESISRGDLTVKTEQQYVGDFHAIERSLDHIIQQLNSEMCQISASSAQVSASSGQVSSGSKTLSDGVAQQAMSIAHLQDAFEEVSQHMERTAADAVEASKRAGQVGQEIAESTGKMHELTDAMGEIKASSDEIGKIIQTIEDIAYQTNILALNAAVEATRAGAAGKGFAVVADEVRTLAGRSAEASQSTAALIRRSADAVEHGVQITDETAAHLSAVAAGAGEVVSSIDKIAAQSELQASSLDRVRQEVAQISGVIHANSATAEESAAASEELSEQAELLRILVSRFKLEVPKK